MTVQQGKSFQRVAVLSICQFIVHSILTQLNYLLFSSTFSSFLPEQTLKISVHQISMPNGSVTLA